MKSVFVLALLVLSASCENLYQNTKYSVVSVSSKNWDTQVMSKRNIGHVVIAHFYRADDGRSRSFRDVFDDEAKKNKGIFMFVGVDCQENIAICQREDARDFPSIKIYPPVPIPVLPADVELDMKKIVRTASGYVQSKVIEINDDNYPQKMGENPAVPKVLLFTDKPNTPILYKALSLAFDVVTSYPEKVDGWYRPQREQRCLPQIQR
jgi:thiol-disulfide isomerase/thioredoxin